MFELKLIKIWKNFFQKNVEGGHVKKIHESAL